MDNIRCNENVEKQLIVKRVNVHGMQNAEMYIMKLFKQLGKRKLIRVQQDGEVFTMFFDTKEDEHVKNIVIQAAKKDYKGPFEIFKKRKPISSKRRFISYFSTSTHYFLFFN